MFSKLSEEQQILKNFNDKLSGFNKNEDFSGIKYIYFGFNLPGLFKYYKKLNNIIREKYIYNDKIEILNFKEIILSIDEIRQIMENGSME